ncbi:DUF4114 domain-containing protein [Anabaena sp. UHCC 0204]|uniref:DUF4114 domain-containing protein n=1 Tax=Anabaena sp. UHCC 0204 TaxID=2590009 RepID=UPI001444DD40|nr:DUF4114 domain-containing protein [Anabaena sp. UHCC 0204]MTJ06600.1 DUF4114 domain-containing protein [Anabaena sp. UHCC 0204]
MSEAIFNLSTLDGNNGFIIKGEEENDTLGYSVSNAGDMNGDGIDDIVIGAPLANPNNQGDAGKTYVVFGSKEGFSQTIDLSTLDGTKGFVINGAASADESGRSVSNIGDMNGDGVDDLAIGAPGPIANSLGNAYVIFGSKESNYFSNPIELSNLGNKGVTIPGSTFELSSNAGWAVSSAGDLNGDGIKDLLIGATNPGNNGPGIYGESYVIFGKTNLPSVIDLDSPDFGFDDGLIIYSNDKNNLGNLGYSVSDAGDMNGDGVDDIIIGAPYADPNGNNSGSSFVIYGRKQDNPFTYDINVSNLNPNDGFTINGQDVDQSGFFVSKAGDINGDGIGDLIIGARDGGIEFTGKSYVVFGKEGGFDNTVELSQLNGNNGFAINGIAPFNNFGWSVSDLKDVNDDGIDDIIIGAPFANSKGQAYVVYGSKTPFSPTFDISSLNGENGFVIDGLSIDKELGFSVSGAGDVNGDGVKDIIISSPFADANGIKSGAAYVIFGKFVNQAPTDLALSNTSINENVPVNTVVGSLSTIDPNQNDTFTYSLVAGDGDADNSAFSINGHSLVVNFSPDFETKSNYTVRVRTTDKGGLIYEKQLTITINDIDETLPNSAPTDLGISNTSIDENVAAFSVVGVLTTTDPDAGDTFTYHLVAGEGDTDNTAFSIEGDQLKINFSPDFETKSNYSIRVKTQDAAGLIHEKQLTITINDINETGTNTAPTDLGISNTSIDENVAANSVVGVLTTTDPDAGDTFTYHLIEGDGDDDNGAFTIDGDQLKINFSPDFETKSNYSIRVKTQDAAGLIYEKALTININDINENGNGGTASNKFLTKISDDVFNIKANNGNATLDVKLTGRSSSFINEIGVFTVDDAAGTIDGIAPGAAGYAEKALLRSQVIFSALTNPPAGFDPTNLSRLLGFNSNDNLRFYLVKGGSTESVLNNTTAKENVLFPAPSTLKITDLGSDSFSLAWEDGSGNPNGFEDLLVTIKASDKAISLGTNLQNKPQGESLDLRNITGTVNAEFVVNREASFNNFIGFYRITDENGGIDINGDGTADILPGQDGYIQAALNGRVPDINLTVNNSGTAVFNATLHGGSLFVPFLIANGTPDALLDSDPNNNPNIYFTFLGANSDGADHVRILGDNTFGFEDLFGGGDKDFNDMVVKVNLTPVA